jgi:protein TonB
MNLRKAFFYSLSFHVFLLTTLGTVLRSKDLLAPVEAVIVVDLSLSHNRNCQFSPHGEKRGALRPSAPQKAQYLRGLPSRPSPSAETPPETATGKKKDAHLGREGPLDAETQVIPSAGNGHYEALSSVSGGSPNGPRGTNEPVGYASGVPGNTDSTTSKGIADAPAVLAAFNREHFAIIQEAIIRNLTYPSLARRRGWSGTVKVSFVVHADGTADTIRVVESSGRELLDRNSLEAVKKAAPFPRPPTSAVIVMPVTYRINDG